MLISADCWDLLEDGVSNIQEDSAFSKVNAGNVGGTCVSLIALTIYFGSWRSLSSRVLSTAFPHTLFSLDPE